MKKATFLFIIISALAMAFTSSNAIDIMKKVDQNMLAVKDKSAIVEMQMINLKNNSKKIKRAVLYQKGLDKKLFRYTYPESDKGIASLSLPDAVYLYLPMFKKPKKITNLAESNSFNKSDFSLEDQVNKPYLEIYNPKFLREENGNYVIDLVPKKPGNSSYSHLIAHINGQYFYPEKFEYFDKKNQKVKVATYEYKQIKGIWVSNKVTMTNLRKNHRTVFIMSNIKINTGLSNDLFTPEKMLEE